MEELDLLKKHWKKNENFPKFSKDEIQHIIHKRSSSIVKWIFYISVIEFALGIVGSFFITSFISKEEMIPNKIYEKMDTYSPIISILFYMVLVYFIFNFYKMYRKIAVDSSTRELMKNILKTRKIVNKYIVFNVVVVMISFMVGGIIGMLSIDHSDDLKVNALLFNGILSAILLVMSCVLALFIWLFYRIIYGLLLKKLDKNYQELKKIDL